MQKDFLYRTYSSFSLDNPQKDESQKPPKKKKSVVALIVLFLLIIAFGLVYWFWQEPIKTQYWPMLKDNLSWLSEKVGFQKTTKETIAQHEKATVMFLASGKTVSVEVVNKESDRNKGLSKRMSLSKDAGMLFVYDQPVKPSFWMKDVYFPLDIIFISEDFEILEFKENLKSCINSCQFYTPSEPIQYALEVNGGYVTNNGIELGSRVKITYFQSEKTTGFLPVDESVNRFPARNQGNPGL
jgi:uncharacterized membrane protein (UPF0127 family)